MGRNKNIIIEINGEKFSCTPGPIHFRSYDAILFVGHVSLTSHKICVVDESILYQDILNNEKYSELFNNDTLTFHILNNLQNNFAKYSNRLLEASFLIFGNQKNIEKFKNEKLPVLDNTNYDTFDIKDLDKKNTHFFRKFLDDLDYDYTVIIEDK